MVCSQKAFTLTKRTCEVSTKNYLLCYRDEKKEINGFFTSYNEIFSTLSDWFILPKKFVKKPPNFGVSAQLSSLPLEHSICISNFM